MKFVKHIYLRLIESCLKFQTNIEYHLNKKLMKFEIKYYGIPKSI